MNENGKNGEEKNNVEVKKATRDEDKKEFIDKVGYVLELEKINSDNGIVLSDDILTRLKELKDLRDRLLDDEETAIDNEWVKLKKVYAELNADKRLSQKQKYEKVVRLKNFAIENGYDVPSKTVEDLNDIEYEVNQGKEIDKAKSKDLDRILGELTEVTYPTTVEMLSSDGETKAFGRFKKYLIGIGIAALLLSFAGFVLAAMNINVQVGSSVMAMSLGVLGAVVYSLFNVLRVVPPQAFNLNDEYTNYARLVLGLFLGWVFFFAFAMSAYSHLPEVFEKNNAKTKTEQNASNQNKSESNQNSSESNQGASERDAGNGEPKTPAIDSMVAFLLLIPFIAGYSTKFVVGVLERVIYALEAALGIEEKRERSAQRARVHKGGG